MPTSGLQLMTDGVQQIIIDLPEDEPRSRLEPYRESILRWRRQGRSYRRIRQVLACECKVKVAYETLRRFVQRRSRPRKAQPEAEPRSTAIAPALPDQLVAPRIFTRRSPEEIAAFRDAARSSNHKPAFQREETKPLFTYDPDRPLTNKPT